MRFAVSALTIACAIVLAPVGAHAVVVNQTDTFESGTTENWFAGGGPFGAVPPVPPQNIVSGGPAGAGDNFLQITASGGTGPGSRLVAMNATQWSGNYTAAGVFSISMDLRNFGSSDLAIRLFLEDAIPGPPVNTALTATAALLVANSGWTHVVFDVSATGLIGLTGDVGTLLSNTTILRIVHAPDASAGTGLSTLAPTIAGVLGVDNISTEIGVTDIHEPVSIALLSASLLGFALVRRRWPSHPFG